MGILVRILALLRRPDVVGLLAFLGCMLIIVVLHNELARFFLGIDIRSIADNEEYETFSHIAYVLNSLLAAIAGLMVYSIMTLLRIEDLAAQRAQVMVRQQTKEISLSRERFQVLYDSSPIPYFLMDDAGLIHNPNKAALRFFGGAREECEVLNFYAQIEQNAGSDDTQTLLKTKVEHRFPISREEMKVRTFSGKSKWALVSIYSIEKASQVPLRHLVTLVDITEERESEQVKSDFLLLASHQLRTPMTTIKWYIDYLLHTPSIELPDNVRDYLQEIDIGNERMIELVNTLLTVSRLEMGTLAPEYVTLHLNEVVQDVLNELASDIKKRSTHVVLHTDGDDTLTTDRTMVRICIHNLLTNAIKYTPQGKTVRVNCDFTAAGCTFTVSDEGCGIPLPEQEKIFTKMFRASNARKISTGGTGLGLHLTRSFVKKLGGSIEFTSQVNVGTTFTITLPRVAPEA